MFTKDTENKIIDYIKKSPLGTSSTEIAKSIGLNRMTITKYLAIIKEKALIDFKQFGMAKLWFIPVKLTKESFLIKTIDYFADNIPKEQFIGLSEKAGIGLGEEINQIYLKFYDTQRLSFDQICDTFSDLGKKLHGTFKVRAVEKEKISIEILQPAFEEKQANLMNKLLSAVFAKIASLNLGYARAFVARKENGNVVIEVFLKKEESKS